MYIITRFLYFCGMCDNINVDWTYVYNMYMMTRFLYSCGMCENINDDWTQVNVKVMVLNATFNNISVISCRYVYNMYIILHDRMIICNLSILKVPDGGYSWNASCALSLISTFLLLFSFKEKVKQWWSTISPMSTKRAITSKQWWSTIPPTSTKWTISSHLNSLNSKTIYHMWL